MFKKYIINNNIVKLIDDNFIEEGISFSSASDFTFVFSTYLKRKDRPALNTALYFFAIDRSGCVLNDFKETINGSFPNYFGCIERAFRELKRKNNVS